MNQMLEDEEPSSPDMMGTLRNKSLRTHTIKHNRSIRGKGQDPLLPETEAPYVPPQFREDILAEAHFKKVERQLFDEDDQDGGGSQGDEEGKHSDDEDVYDQYRGNEDEADINKRQPQKDSGPKKRDKKGAELSRSPDEREQQQKKSNQGGRLNMS